MDRIVSLWKSNVLLGCASALLLSLAPTTAEAATAYRVADLSSVRRGIGSNPGALGLVGNRALFTSFRGGLIVSNGTNAGTQELLVGTFFESLGSAGARHYLLQTEVDITSGQFVTRAQPWITDGTAAGTFALSTTARGPIDRSRRRLFSAVPGASRVFFAFDDGMHGEELWTSDGTRAGTHLVADLVAGSGSSFVFGPLWLPSAGGSGLLLFSALDPVEGWRLWSTDGTSAGTRLVRDFVTSSSEASGLPQALLAQGGRATVLVLAEIGSLTLWTTDGTEAGTVRIPGTPSWSNISRSVVAGGRLYFFGRDPQLDDDDLWVTDGTTQGTLRLTDFDDPRPILGSGNFQAVETDRGIAFFAYDTVNGSELRVSDGTVLGTRVVDACVGTCDGVDRFSAPTPIFHRGRVYWSAADDGSAGYELFVSDALGGGVQRIANLCSGPCGAPYRVMTGAGPRVYFVSLGGHRALWRTSGTAASTARLTEFDDSFSFGEHQLLAVGGTLLFANYRMATGAELWTSNGRANGTRLLRDLAPGDFGGSNPGRFMASANRAFFVADDGVHGPNQLWTSDGTAAGTRFVTNLSSSQFGPFSNSWKALGNRVIFLLGESEPTLWSSDGTPSGTRSLLPESAFVRSSRLTQIGSRVYFLAQQGSEASPWMSDGTVAGTRRLSAPPSTFIDFGNFFGTPRGDVVYTESNEFGFPWYVLDSAGGAARPLHAVYPFLNEKIAGGTLGDPVTIGNKLYFAIADDSGRNAALWEFDFTARRARNVGRLDADRSLNGGGLLTDGRRIWIHLSISGGNQTWRWSGGSSVVAERIDDPVTLLGIVGGKYYGKAVLDPTLGISAVVGDGSLAGSEQVRDAGGEPLITFDFNRLAWVAFGNRSAVCIAPTSVWITDGTPARTSRLHEFDRDVLGSSPPQLVSVGGRVFFRGWDPEAGFELWAVRADANSAD